MQNYFRKLVIDEEVPQTINTSAIDLGGADVGALQVIADAVFSAKTFAAAAVNTTDDTATITAHGYITGTQGQVSNPGTLPTGIVAATDYFLIVVNANTVKFATSYANAIAGTAINLTAQGSGTNTFTPSAKSGSVQVQVTCVSSPSSSDWINKGDAVVLTGGAQNVAIEYDRKDLAHNKMRIAYTHTSGTFRLQAILNLKV